jgi:hypothetical protein
MRAAVRLTAKIERRLKKFERELTRPVPGLTSFRRKQWTPAETGAVDIPPARGRVLVGRHVATNDNGGQSLHAVPAVMKAPPVSVFGGEGQAKAPSVTAEPREKPQKKKPSPKPAPKSVAKTKNAPQERNAAKLLFLATAAFSLSFLVVFKVIGHLA